MTAAEAVASAAAVLFDPEFADTPDLPNPDDVDWSSGPGIVRPSLEGFGHVRPVVERDHRPASRVATEG